MNEAKLSNLVVLPARRAEKALKMYRWLVLAGLVYNLLTIGLTLVSLFYHLDRPYGGFLWSWDNSHGLYRVDNFSPGETDGLQAADFILDVNRQGGSAIQLYTVARQIYVSAQRVCDTNLTQPIPHIRYTILRRGETLDVDLPVRCFRLPSLVRFAIAPLILAMLIWSLGYFVYHTGTDQELNLVFTFTVCWAVNIIVMQAAITPPVDTRLSQWIAVAITNPSPILLAASGYHLVTILPSQHPAPILYRTRLIWGLIIPASLLAVGGLRFWLSPAWTPLVGLLDNLAGWGTGFFMTSLLVVLLLRYGFLFRTTHSRAARRQVTIIATSAAALLMLIPVMVAQQLPHHFRWIPVNQSSMLFWIMPVYLGVAFAILRYQVFPRRVASLEALIALGVAVVVALAAASIPLLGPEVGFVALFVVLSGVSLFWSIPNPVQRIIRRIAAPGSIERQTLQDFNADIQQGYDLDTLPLCIVQSLEQHLELDFAAVWLESRSGEWVLEACTDRAPLDLLPEYISNDKHNFTSPRHVDEGKLKESGIIVTLPLTTSGQTTGLVGLSKRWTEEVFDDTDLETLGVIGHQAALALGLARLVRTLRLAPLQVEQAQLAERDRIAQELHDSTQQHLAQQVFALERVRQALYADPTQAELLLDQSIASINQAARDLRSILRNLMPDRLIGRPLSASLQEYFDHAGQIHSNVQMRLQVDPLIEVLLPSEHKLALLRICQQAFDNALTHAQPCQVSVTIQPSLDQRVVEFAIVDDGRGFAWRSTGEYLAHGHNGLYIMESRALKLGGRLTVESTPGQGTVVKGFVRVESAS